MDKKEKVSVLLVIVLTLFFPSIYAYTGSSPSFVVDVSDLSLAGFEETLQPNTSYEFEANTKHLGEGVGENYNASLGLSKKLGPIAFNISSITPQIAKNDSIINCTGVNAFAYNNFEMPKHYYKFTNGSGDILTDWSESGVLNCSEVGYCSEPNLTCHFKVDDSHLNSTEIEETITVDTTNPYISLVTPYNNTNVLLYSYLELLFNVTDIHSINSCNLIIDGVLVANITSPVKNSVLNFSYQILTYNETTNQTLWSVTCTDEVGNTGASETRVIRISDEYISIENMGVTGFENVSNDYTQSRDVILRIEYVSTPINCRIRNDEANWTHWGACQDFINWRLSDGDGQKTVYVETNHSTSEQELINLIFDTIILEKNASHIDTTAPENFTVYDVFLYSNNSESLSFYWSMPVDREAELLNQQLTFSYVLKDSNGSYVSEVNITSESRVTLTNLSLIEGHRYSLVVNATNPSGLSTTSESNGTTIDLTPPLIINISGYPNNISWSNINNLTFNWTSNDSLSGVAGYSMILDNVSDTVVDELPEEDYTNNRTYENKQEGTYYFHIRAYDYAGNYGETSTYGPVRIDLTPPSVPTPINPIMSATSSEINFTWISSTDSLSGILWYNVTLINNGTGDVNNYITTDSNYTLTGVNIGDVYFIIVNAVDNAGNERSSEFIETEALIITSFIPDGVVVASNPIIKIETNKVAICLEDYTNNSFLYTNSKYHETKISQGNGAYTVRIICTDDDGFMAIKNISYTVNHLSIITSILLSSINDTLIGNAVNALLTVNDNIAQVEKQRFKVYMNNNELTDFTVTETGIDGDYLIKFLANTVGMFNISVEIDNITSNTESVNVNNVNLNVIYTGASSSNTKSRIVYADSQGSKFGLASDSKEVSTSINADQLILNSIADGKAYLFFTKDDFNVNSKNKELNKDLFKKVKNTFGYQLDNSYDIKSSVNYDTIVIEGLTTLNKGHYSLFIRNLGQNNNNQTIIRIELE